MIRVNLRSVFLCTRAVLPGMIARKWGRIISISSQLAHKGAADMAHYAAAKAGVIGFTRSLAYEVARDGITVNCICPGPVDTELFRRHPGGLAQAQAGRAADRPRRQRRRDRARRRPAGLGRGLLLYRRQPQPERRRRHGLRPRVLSELSNRYFCGFWL